MRKIHSQDELHNIVKHVEYEIDALVNTARLIAKNDPDLPRSISNSLVTAYVIHARVLAEFFYKKDRFVDDVNAWDYCEKWKLGVSRAKQSSPWIEQPIVLADLWKDASKHAAHLSTQRVNVQREDG